MTKQDLIYMNVRGSDLAQLLRQLEEVGITDDIRPAYEMLGKKLERWCKKTGHTVKEMMAAAVLEEAKRVTSPQKLWEEQERYRQEQERRRLREEIMAEVMGEIARTCPWCAERFDSVEAMVEHSDGCEAE